MWLFIEAQDVLMFRDGKPFNSGDAHTAMSSFPPTGITVQGFLRALYLHSQGILWDDYKTGENARLNDLLGNPKTNTFGQVSFSGPYLAERNDTASFARFFPIPADIVQKPLRVLKPTDDVLSLDGVKLHTLDMNLDDEMCETPHWLRESGLENYCKGEIYPLDIVSSEALFVYEARVGTAINYATNTVRHDEGMLYSANFVRPQPNVGLMVMIPDDSPLTSCFQSLGDSQTLRLGGEGRSARVERISYIPETILSLQSNKSFKIMLLTPTYLQDGWLPQNAQLKHAMRAVALQRPQALGGWDTSKAHPRPIYRYVPAGSVYHFHEGITLGTQFLEAHPTLPLSQFGYGEYIAVPTA